MTRAQGSCACVLPQQVWPSTTFLMMFVPAGGARLHPGLWDAGPLWCSEWRSAVRVRVWLGRSVCKLPRVLARVRCVPCHARCWTSTALRLAEAAGDMRCMQCRRHMQHPLWLLSSLQQRERRHCICRRLSSSVAANHTGSGSGASRPRLQLCTA